MARLREHIRRRLMAAAPRLCACFFALTALCAVLGGLFAVMRFVTVTTSEGTAQAVFAPQLSDDYMLALAGVSRAPEDETQIEDSGDGFITLHREKAFPVQVTADGTTATYKTVPHTVADALRRMGIHVGTDDYAEPALDTMVTADTGSITLHRVEYQYRTVNDVLPYETETQYSSLFYRSGDYVLTVQEGQNGFLEGEMRDKLVDGEVVESTIVQQVRYQEPVTEILKTYQEGAPVSSVEAPEGITVENGVPSSYSTVYEMKATGYYSPRGKGSSGLGLYYGTFAVDPTLIPYGTKVYIVSQNGKFVYGWAIATDTGAFIHSNRMQVDLFYETYKESAINAVQQVYVYVP